MVFLLSQLIFSFIVGIVLQRIVMTLVSSMTQNGRYTVIGTHSFSKNYLSSLMGLFTCKPLHRWLVYGSVLTKQYYVHLLSSVVLFVCCRITLTATCRCLWREWKWKRGDHSSDYSFLLQMYPLVIILGAKCHIGLLESTACKTRKLASGSQSKVCWLKKKLMIVCGFSITSPQGNAPGWIATRIL